MARNSKGSVDRIRMSAEAPSGEFTTGEKVALGALGATVLGLFGLAVGTERGRSVCSGIMDVSAAYDERCRNARLNREEYKVQLQKLVLDKKLELCRLESHVKFFDDTWSQRNQLRREIRILEEEVAAL